MTSVDRYLVEAVPDPARPGSAPAGSPARVHAPADPVPLEHRGVAVGPSERVSTRPPRRRRLSSVSWRPAGRRARSRSPRTPRQPGCGGCCHQPPDHPTSPCRRTSIPDPAGVDASHRLDIDPARVSFRSGIPCTNPLRALVDLAATADHRTVSAPSTRPYRRRLVSGQALDAELERRTARGRRGVRPLTADPGRSRRDRGARRQRPRTGNPLLLDRGASRHRFRGGKAGPDDRYRLDFMLLPPVAMEVDGYTHHWSPEAKAADEARRNQLRLDGLFLLVYTWIDIRAEQRRVYRELTTALALQPTSRRCRPGSWPRRRGPGRPPPPTAGPVRARRCAGPCPRPPTP